MENTRKIRQNEIDLVHFLLGQLELSVEEHVLPEIVHEYEGGVMGSISFQLTENPQYAGDLIQVRYMDTDSIPVIITLTHDVEGKLLDLDFWKADFSKLLHYPTPEQIELL